jgi:hypothetical protein
MPVTYVQILNHIFCEILSHVICLEKYHEMYDSLYSHIVYECKAMGIRIVTLL